MLKTHPPLKLGIAVVLAIALILVMVLPAFATHSTFIESVTCNLKAQTITISVSYLGGGPTYDWGYKIYVDGVERVSDYGFEEPAHFVKTYSGFPDGVLVEGAVVTAAWNNSVTTVCHFNTHDEITPPDIFLSAVCEPNDGFSFDGWMSVHSNAADKPYGTVLFVAAGPDGPWFETGFLQPPYILSQADVDALTALVNLTDYHELWMKASKEGTPANLGSMIQDREWNMDALCGT